MEDSQEELLEHRLAEKIEKRVRNRLIWPILVVISALSFFGYDLLSDMREAAIRSAEDKVRPVVARVDDVARSASERIQEGQVQLEISKQMLDFIEQWMSERRIKLSNLEDSLNVKSEKISRNASQMAEELLLISNRIDNVSENIDSQEQAAANLYAGAGNFVELARQVALISESVNVLNRKIDRIQNAVSEGLEIAPVNDNLRLSEDAVGDDISRIIEASEAIVRNEIADGILYIHFMDTQRRDITQLESFLKNRGWTVPLSQKVSVMPPQPQVRYFFDEDREEAEAVAKQTMSWLKESGLTEKVIAKDFTHFSGQKPRPGVLEIWLNPNIQR